MNTQAIKKALRAIDRLKNCGIGPGGFQPGNTCARGGGGGGGSYSGDSSGHGMRKLGSAASKGKAKKYAAGVLEKDGKVVFDDAKKNGAVFRMVIRKHRSSYVTDRYSRGEDEDGFVKESTGEYLGSSRRMSASQAIEKGVKTFGHFNRVGADNKEIWKVRKLND